MTDRVRPAMLILARESRGWTQTKLAEEASVPQPRISKLETGQLNTSDGDLAKLAAALRYPESFFFQDDPRSGPGSSCVFHRKLQSLGIIEARRVNAMFDIVRMQVSNILRMFDYDQTIYPFPRMDPDQDGHSVASIAEFARAHWHLPMGPVGSVVSTLETAGAIVVKCRFGSEKIDAMSQVSPGLPPVLFVNSERPTDRMRHSLMHEAGHLIMHETSFADIEAQASQFAAEVLMPRREFMAELRPPVNIQRLAALKPRWRVSLHAMVYHAKDLEIITERQAQSLYAYMGKMGWKKNEPLPLPPEEPSALAGMISEYLSKPGNSIATLAAVVHSIEDDFRSYHTLDRPRLRVAR